MRGGGQAEELLIPGPITSPQGSAWGKKAIGAAAASLLTCAYHMISSGTYYEDLGPDHFEKRQSEGRRIKKLVNQRAAIGYDVEIKPITA